MSSFSSCALAKLLPGNAVPAVSTSQSSNLSDADCAKRGRKNGRSMMYEEASLSSGRTRSVPSLGPVVDSDVQPCQGRNMEHWFL